MGIDSVFTEIIVFPSTEKSTLATAVASESASPLEVLVSILYSGGGLASRLTVFSGQRPVKRPPLRFAGLPYFSSAVANTMGHIVMTSITYRRVAGPERRKTISMLSLIVSTPSSQVKIFQILNESNSL
jgi:hypothetical protein